MINFHIADELIPEIMVTKLILKDLSVNSNMVLVGMCFIHEGEFEGFTHMLLYRIDI